MIGTTSGKLLPQGGAETTTSGKLCRSWDRAERAATYRPDYRWRVRVVIAGGHGKIALRLERLLADRGDSPVGLVRNPAHFEDIRAAGAEPVLCDLELASPDEVVEAVRGADAGGFAAGGGPGRGAPR